tara:strand:+ start:64 stop:399 length:336 start_codon:yes stop_codon:yes gene_type:complete
MPKATPTTTFTWTINGLDRTTADGIVFTAHYSIEGNDGTYSAGAYGSVGLEAPAKGDDVIPYSDLTEFITTSWTKAAIGGDEKVAEIEAALQGQIDEQRTPTKASGTPWAS